MLRTQMIHAGYSSITNLLIILNDNLHAMTPNVVALKDY